MPRLSPLGLSPRKRWKLWKVCGSWLSNVTTTFPGDAVRDVLSKEMFLPITVRLVEAVAVVPAMAVEGGDWPCTLVAVGETDGELAGVGVAYSIVGTAVGLPTPPPPHAASDRVMAMSTAGRGHEKILLIASLIPSLPVSLPKPAVRPAPGALESGLHGSAPGPPRGRAALLP
jgi:hypothetical protein